MSDTLGIYELGRFTAQTLPDAVSIQVIRPHNPLDIPPGTDTPLNAFGYPDILLGSPNATLMLDLLQARNLYNAQAQIIPTNNQILGTHLDMFDTTYH